MPVRILAISGSLRSSSSNSALVRALKALAPTDIEVEIWNGLGTLPWFNPDLEDHPNAAVDDLRARLTGADALLISSPEYAHGVPGVLKNALDWLVGSGELYGKPTALINASPRAVYAYASLIETLSVMSARLVPGASITVPVQGRLRDEQAIVADDEVSAALRTAINALATSVEQQPLTPTESS